MKAPSSQCTSKRCGSTAAHPSVLPTAGWLDLKRQSRHARALWCPGQFLENHPRQTLLQAAPGWVGARCHPWAGNLGGAGGFSLTQHNCCASRLPAGESGHQRTAFITCYKTAISSQASSLITQPVLSFHFITGINNEFKAWKAIKMCD